MTNYDGEVSFLPTLDTWTPERSFLDHLVRNVGKASALVLYPSSFIGCFKDQQACIVCRNTEILNAVNNKTVLPLVQWGAATSNYEAISFTFSFHFERHCTVADKNISVVWKSEKHLFLSNPFILHQSFPRNALWPCINKATVVTVQPRLCALTVFHMSPWWMPCYINKHNAMLPQFESSLHWRCLCDPSALRGITVLTLATLSQLSRIWASLSQTDAAVHLCHLNHIVWQVVKILHCLLSCS